MRFIHLLVLIPAAFVVPGLALGATYYVDASIGTSGNGTSWASAWKSFSNIKGLRAGDIVYISGGPNGQTYNTGEFLSASGSSGSPITYKVSTEAGRNGVVTINKSGGTRFITSNPSQGYGQWITFDGNVNGARNLVIQGWGEPVYAESSSRGITLRYVKVNGSVRFYGAYNIELDHVFVDAPSGSDRAVKGPQCGGGTPSYTLNSVHDSIVQVRWGGTSGFGDDAFGGLNCATFYNNQVLGVYDSNYNYGQHQDGIQTGGRYLKIYNNYFYNMQNYPVYFEALGGETLSNFRIYNNVFYAPSVSQGYQAVAIGCTGQACVQDDIIVANNTFVGGANCVWINQGYPGTVRNSYVANNICYNAGSIRVSTAAQYNNTTSTSGIAFVNATSDWHLTSGATAAIGQGINSSVLTSEYTTDKDGDPRTDKWDIGAYEYSSSGTLPSPPTALTAITQ